MGKNLNESRKKCLDSTHTNGLQTNSHSGDSSFYLHMTPKKMVKNSDEMGKE